MIEWFKFDIDQKVFLSINWGITAHTVKWFFKEKDHNFYIIRIMWKNTLYDEVNVYDNLEEAKNAAYEFKNNILDQLNKQIEEIKEQMIEIENTNEIIEVAEELPVPEVKPDECECKATEEPAKAACPSWRCN